MTATASLPDIGTATAGASSTITAGTATASVIETVGAITMITTAATIGIMIAITTVTATGTERYSAASMVLMAMPFTPPFSSSVPVTLTFFSMNGVSFRF